MTTAPPAKKLDDLPECLKRPLVFGDREQIEALHKLKEEAPSDEKRLFRVTVEIDCYYEEEIWAHSAQLAEEAVKKTLDLHEAMVIGDADITIKAEEIKNG